MNSTDLLEPHLIAAGVGAVIVLVWLGHYFVRFLTGVAGDD